MIRSKFNPFTLFEIIVVLALLALILGITAPSLAGFTKSRAVNEEARRFIAATRYAASEAASRGERITMTILTEDGRYELVSETGALDSGINQNFTLTDGIVIELGMADGQSVTTTTIGFTPTGLIESDQVEQIRLRNRFDESLLATIVLDTAKQRFVDHDSLVEDDE